MECVVEVGDKKVRSLLSNGFHQGAVSAHRLNLVDHFSQRNENAVIEFTLAKVNGLLEPNELKHQCSPYGEQAGEDQNSNALTGHATNLARVASK